MDNQITRDRFNVIATLSLLFLTALGNAALMLAAALITLGLLWAFHEPRAKRNITRSALNALVSAFVIDVAAH